MRSFIRLCVAAALVASSSLAAASSDPYRVAPEYEVHVYEGTNHAHELEAVLLGFGNATAPAQAIPTDEAQWEQYWDATRPDIQFGPHRRLGEFSTLFADPYRAGFCAKDDPNGHYPLKVAAHGAVAQGGINAAGQRWAKVAVRQLVGVKTARRGDCTGQAPVFAYVLFDGVLAGTHKHEEHVVHQGGKTYTFRFIKKAHVGWPAIIEEA